MTRLHATGVALQRVEMQSARTPAGAGATFAKTFDAIASTGVSGNPALPGSARSVKACPGRADRDHASSRGQGNPPEPARAQDPDQSAVPSPLRMLPPAGGLAGPFLSRVRLDPATGLAGAPVDAVVASPAAGSGHVDGETGRPDASGVAAHPDAPEPRSAATPAFVAPGQDGAASLAALLAASFAPSQAGAQASSPGEAVSIPAAQTGGTMPATPTDGQNASGPAGAAGNAARAMPVAGPAGNPGLSQTAAPRIQAIPARPAAGSAASVSSRFDRTVSSRPPSSSQATPAVAAPAESVTPGSDGDPAASLAELGAVTRTTGDASMNPVAGPAQQVLAALRSLGLGSPGETTDSQAAPSAAFDQPAAADRPTLPATPLQSLTIQLQPAHLGAVVLTVQRQDGKLAVSVTVGDSRALRTLEKDRDLLESAVAAAGGSRDSLVLTLASGPNDTAASVAPQSDQSGTPTGAPGDMSQGGAARGERRPDPAPIMTGIEDDQRSAETAEQRMDRGLYL